MESQTTLIKARLIKSMMICLALIVPVAGFNAGTAAQSQSSSTGPIVLKMKRVAGTYTVPCSINGLQLDMILDTGASVVSISQVEAAFMLKNGYLKPHDFRGTSTYTTA